MRTQSIYLLLVFVLVCPSATAQWLQTGGPEGGYIISVAGDESFFYAATFGPVFRMQKNDTTWTPLNQQGVYSLAMSGTTLVAGKGGGGVYRSTDHGMRWDRWVSGLHQGSTVMCFAAKGNDLFAGTDRGVYLSKDHGASWTPSNAGQDSLQVQCLLVKDSTIFAGTWGGGVYRSTDYGTSWAPANNGMTSDIVWSLAVLDTAIFAGTWWSDGIYRSTDDGTTWEPVKSAIWSPDVNTLAVLGTNLFAGTHGGVFLSVDGGTSWSLLFHQPGSIVNSFHVSGTDILAGTFDGVYFSSDTGDSWRSAYAGLIGTVINVLLRDGLALFAGTESSGLFISNDEGASWFKTPLQHDDITSLVVSGTDYFAGTPNGVSRSTDGGSHWSPANAGITMKRIAALAVIPGGTGSSHLFAGTDSSGVFLSTNSGSSWTPVNSGLTDTTVRCLAVIDSSLFVGSGSGVFLSTDKGASWLPADTGLTDTPVQCFAVSNGSLFAGTEVGGVFLSTDLGSSWNPVNNGLTDVNVLCLAARGTRVFAGTWFGGVFLSENGGATWARVDTGLGKHPVRALDMSGTDLSAGTRGGGVWRRPLSEMITAIHISSGDVPSGFRLGQNFPNPFNPSTEIRYQIAGVRGQGSGTSHVRLAMYDLLGREVATLVNEQKAPGSYSVRFEANGLASGVYFYRLRAGDFVQTKKLVILR